LICLFLKEMAEESWVPPPKIEDLYAAANGSQMSSINRPTAGPRQQKDLPVGKESLQLYSLATPNGKKVSILLEELGVPYDAHFISIMKGDQFDSGFVDVNPNSKIPALVDLDAEGGPLKLFESGAICLYLAEKYGKFLPQNRRDLALANCWIQWQMAGQGPMTGNFGHFFVYAPANQIQARNYGVARYGMEVQRLCSVLDNHLSTHKYLVGEEYSVADIVVFPWFHQLLTGYKNSSGIAAGDFLSVSQYKHANEWAARILERPAVQRGLLVCNNPDNAKPWLAVPSS